MFMIYLSAFAKRCPLTFHLNTGITRVQASVAGKKPRGLGVLLGVSREPRHRPTLRDWLVFLHHKWRVRKRDFVTLIRVSSQKAVQRPVG